MLRRRPAPPPRPIPTRNDQYVSRAFRAYWRTESVQRSAFPHRDWSKLESHFGREYVVLRDPRGVIAVYRVRAYDGILRRLKRWPRSIGRVPA